MGISDHGTTYMRVAPPTLPSHRLVVFETFRARTWPRLNFGYYNFGYSRPVAQFLLVHGSSKSRQRDKEAKTHRLLRRK
jgi:hypothetical protein